MKRILCLLLTIILLITALPLSVFAEVSSADFNEKVLDIIEKYDADLEYYSEIVIDAKNNTIQVDDEKEQSLKDYDIDLGAVPSAEWQIPAVPVLEAMGKDAELDEDSGEIIVSENGEQTVLDLGQADIPEKDIEARSVENGVETIFTENGKVTDTVGYFSEQQAKEELGLDIVYTEDEKVVLSSPFQTKRLIVESEQLFLEKRGAVASVHKGNTTVLQFKTEQQARDAYAYYQTRKGVRSVCPDRVMRISRSEPNMKTYGRDYLQSDRYIAALKQNNKTSTVKVAVVDTGVDATHPYLKSRLLTGYNVLTKKACTKDNHMHGTHVSGIIASATPETVKILPVTVLDSEGRGTELTVKAGIDYAVKQKVQVINMSLGGLCTQANCPVKKGIDAAIKAGITVVVAAGNDSADTKTFCPAKHSACITVSACNADGQLARFANYGASVDVCAPGVQIYSSVPGGKYQLADGTSMAAPFVAAEAALLYTANPALKPVRAEQLIRSYCADMLFQGWDKYTGCGLVNLGIALGDKDLPADCYSAGKSGELSVKLFSKVSPYWMPVTAAREDDRIPTDRSFSTATSNKNVAYFDGKFVRFVGVGECEITIGSGEAQTKQKVSVQKQEVWLDYAASSFGGGDGTAKNPYQIKTAAQLAKFALDIRNGNSFTGKYFKLMNNINLFGKKWITATCIKKDYTYLAGLSYYGQFEGVFDGANHRILGMDVFDIPIVKAWSDSEPVNYSWYQGNGGFLGAILNATVKNLGIENAVCNVHDAEGLLVGSIYQNSRILNCYTSGYTMGSGLFGSANNYNVRIANCYSAASVYKGGICGYLYSSLQKGGVVLDNVFFCGQIIHSDENASGNFSENIYAQKGKNYTHLYNCFSAVQNENGIGFATLSEYSKLYNCYYLNTNQKGIKENVGSAVNLKPKALAYFKAKSFYAPANWNAKYPWDFKNTWAIDPKVNNGFPYLKNMKPAIATASVKTGTWADYAATAFAGGNGTKKSPFLVANAAQLARITSLYRFGGGENTYFKLTADIDLSAHEWLPIGTGRNIHAQQEDYTSPERKHFFSGNIDGAGHTVSGMHILSQGYHIGFVARLYSGSVKNLHFTDAYVSGERYFGIICGENLYYSTILNCSVSGSLGNIGTQNYFYAAPITGKNSCSGVIKGCTVTISEAQTAVDDTVVLSAFAATNEGEIEQSCLDATLDAQNRYTLCYQNSGFIKNCGAQCANIEILTYNIKRQDYKNCYLADSERYWVTGNLFENTDKWGTVGAAEAATDFAGFSESIWNKAEGELPMLRLPAAHSEFVFPAAKWQAATTFAGGDGTKYNPYLIATPEQLAKLREYTPAYKNKYFRLIRDIDLAGKVFNDEDDSLSTIACFVLDGNHKTISNPIIKNSTGLFNISFSGLIRDLNIKNVQGIGSSALVTTNVGTISGCTVSGMIRSSSRKGSAGLPAGGICSFNAGTIEKCFVHATFYALSSAGAIAGENSGTIRNCYGAGIMVNSGTPAIVGLKNSLDDLTAVVENCYLTINGQVPRAEVLESFDYQTVWNHAEREGEYPTLKTSAHYNINYVTDGGKLAANTEYDFTPNSNVVLKAPTKKDNFFDGWYKDKAFTQKVAQVGFAEVGDTTLYAKWLPIEAPTVTALAATNSIKLSWNKCLNATHYRVYEYNTATKKYKVLANTAARSYLISGKAAGTSYVYLVRAYYKDAAGREIISPYTAANRVTVQTLCAAPTVQAVVGANAVKLKWNAVRGATYYRVYEYSAATKQYTLVRDNLTANSCLMKSVKSGTHYYLVRAVNESGASKFTANNLVKVNVK